jgi:hypothetical protein
MIADAKEAGWQFVFLSADESAISDSSSLNIDASNAAFFRKNTAGSNEMWKRVANRSVAYRSSGVHSMRMDAAGDDALIAKQLKAEYAAQNASAGASAGVGVAQNPNAGASAGAVVGATQNPNAGVAVPGVGVVGADVPPRNERSRGRGKKN